MGFIDFVLMILIAGGAVYLLYCSFNKKKESCLGCCDGGTCGNRVEKK